MSIWQKIGNGFDLFSGVIKSMRGDPAAWERSIVKFEAQDRVNPPGSDVIVFTGSSSIALWSTLEQDMAPLPVLNRGFGGSKVGDVVRYATRIVIPYHPRAVVLFVGTNDIAWPQPKTASEVYEGIVAFVNIVHTALPETPIYYIPITPTPSRWKYWPIANEANQRIKAYSETNERLHFIDMTNEILGVDGTPRRDLFRLDRLHPNKNGYAVWTSIIKPILEADLNKN